jgi:hypothetical protein
MSVSLFFFYCFVFYAIFIYKKRIFHHFSSFFHHFFSVFSSFFFAQTLAEFFREDSPEPFFDFSPVALEFAAFLHRKMGFLHIKSVFLYIKMRF